jgi:hypothetical protein
MKLYNIALLFLITFCILLTAEATEDGGIRRYIVSMHRNVIEIDGHNKWLQDLVNHKAARDVGLKPNMYFQVGP